jgi:two-component system, NarL family, sensor histidine kinase UhpB
MPEPRPAAGGRRAGWADESEETVATRVSLFTAVVLGALVSIYTSFQSSLVFGAHSEALLGVPAEPVWELLLRAGVNFVSVAVIVLGIALWHPERQRGLRLAGVVIGIAVAATVFRAIVQSFAVYDVTDPDDRAALLAELFSTAVLAAVIVFVSLLQQWVWRRLHRAERTRLTAQQHVVRLLQELQAESLRVRREAALVLHGSVQSVFVVLGSQIGAIADGLDEPRAIQLRAIASELDRLREGELRALSSELYPQDLERGLRAALATLLGRIPSSVALTSDIADGAARIDAADLDISTRVLVYRIVEEAISNALRHGRATALDVHVDAIGYTVEIVVDQDGRAPDAGTTRSGLARLQQYLDLHEGEIALTAGGRFGAGRLRAYFPHILRPIPGARTVTAARA